MAIRRLTERIEGANWEVVANQLGQYGYWEFEDYADYRELDQA
jgi:hypothetical protein